MRNLYLIVVGAVLIAVVFFIASAAWRFWQAAIQPLIEILSGVR